MNCRTKDTQVPTKQVYDRCQVPIRFCEQKTVLNRKRKQGLDKGSIFPQGTSPFVRGQDVENTRADDDIRLKSAKCKFLLCSYTF